MSNHAVTFCEDQTTAVIVFNTDGSISFEGGEQNVPYATRASQTCEYQYGMESNALTLVT